MNLLEALHSMWGNLWSWIFFLKQGKGAVSKPPKDAKRFCVSIPRPGGADKLTFYPLGEYECTAGAKVPGLEFDKRGNIATFQECPHDMVEVETKVIGINYADVCIRWGFYSSANEFVGFPITPGFEFAGKVRRVGSSVKSVKIGDEVFGFTLFGAYSTHIMVPEKFVYQRPENLPVEVAGCSLAVCSTAYYAAFKLADIKEGQTVLIHSAAGGVGSQLVQMCKNTGCKTIGVVGRSRKIAVCESYGCDKTLLKQRLWEQVDLAAPDGIDAVFDANGVATLQQGYDRLKPRGRLVSYGFHTNLPNSLSINPLQWIRLAYSLWKTPTFSPMDMVSSNKSVMGFNLSFLTDEDELREEVFSELIPMITDQKVTVNYSVYDFADVAQAHEDIQSGKTTGKLILTTPLYREEHENWNIIPSATPQG